MTNSIKQAIYNGPFTKGTTANRAVGGASSGTAPAGVPVVVPVLKYAGLNGSGQDTINWVPAGHHATAPEHHFNPQDANVAQTLRARGLLS